MGETVKLGEEMKQKIAKKKNLKKLFSNILKVFGIFLLCYSICLIIIIQLSVIIFGLSNIDSYWFLLIFLSPTIISAVITFLLCRNKKKYSFLANTKWIKFSFSLILIFAFIGSLKSEIEIDIVQAKELLGFEWTLFSLTIALFLAWYLIVEKYLKNEPKEEETGHKRIENIIKKQSFYMDSVSYFLNGILLFINFLCISFVTGQLWINQRISLFMQTFLYFTLYLTINTMQMIFYDIIIPIMVRLLNSREYKMTNEKVVEEVIVGLLEEKLSQENNKIGKEAEDGQAENDDK